ncbi:pyridoxine 5'-phosphate oxidase C-terminal domain-containing protein [Streptomyces sp. CA2R101]|uniref:pyridoxine 5'-phosphate oxidase C-terminal domain-containing protein n=1 Tax=Streptomyces sp. CA2R101 TaxID=3120152 RepID=UPI00300B57E8
MADVRQPLRDLPVFAGELPAFDALETPDDPVELLTAWLLGAIRAQVPEPHAMTVATAGADGNPPARTLTLKDIDADGRRFAAHRDSTEERELAARPYAAVAESADRLAREPGPVAPGWTLHTVRAESVGFWQGDKERKHTRPAYHRADDGWRKELLWP